MIVVVGSVNMDLVVRTPRFPMPGETLLGHGFATYHGGKGANQAVAAARAGGTTALIGRVGADDFGSRLRQALAAEGVAVETLFVSDDAPTGVAVIQVDDAGENSIVVAPGANARLSPADLDASRQLIDQADLVLMQLEIPLDTVIAAAERAAAAGAIVMLDPAPVPATSFDRERLLAHVDVLTPNLHEARRLADLPAGSPEQCASRLAGFGIETVIVTLGGSGVVWAHAAQPERVWRQAAFSLPVVDTTGAGDAFAGALAVARSEGWAWPQAITLAQAAGALAASRPGAQQSLPAREEIERCLQEQPHPEVR